MPVFHATVHRAALLACLLVASAAPGRADDPPSNRPTLYQRLGGYDGVTAYIALVFPRVAGHPDLNHLFRGHGKDSQQRQFQHVVELICQRTGGPCAYGGRPMPAVHDGLGITEAQWSTFMTIIDDGLKEKRYPADVRDEFRALWRSFHDGVVQK
jgi:hemoglobin